MLRPHLARAAVAALAIALLGGALSASCGGDSDDAGLRVIQIELGEMYIEPAEVAIAPGERVRFEVHNAGLVEHDMREERGSRGTPILQPGETASFVAGPYEAHMVFICTVPGHAVAGMLMDLDVEPSP